MDAVKFIKEYRRMCNSYTTNIVNNVDCCLDCPLYGQPCDIASLAISPEDIIIKIEQWSQAHPQKTMIQDFFEKFPNATKDSSGNPMVCPQALGYGDFCCDDTKHNCKECWNRPLEG